MREGKMLGHHIINFTYLQQPPRKFTFEQKELKKWVETWCKGKVLNLFAGKILLKVNEIRNDINTEMPADFHLDANEFVKIWEEKDGGKFDTVILDPPYSYRKSKEKYNNKYIGNLPLLKNSLLKILTKDAYVISLGFDTVGMSKQRGFKKIAICVICHGGDHHDTLCLVEKRIMPTIC